eukprot:CAMPEP_0196580522 /NCGR_PEP_ID=MMETSP1081-20130531/29006_1 /TAXON_ID=36882 /ORGANISM="Pyramimonas amylifera, Strain CCMP720" /LENGTH=125 /DNA_ID=CAMNT_0041900405 /DNA_START=143 /DNA_END=520 /DNA_ORIENTATION=+
MDSYQRPPLHGTYDTIESSTKKIQERQYPAQAPLKYRFLADDHGHRTRPYGVTSRYAQMSHEFGSTRNAANTTSHYPGIVTNKLHGNPIRHPQDEHTQQTSSGRYVQYSHSLMNGANPNPPLPFP